MFLLLALLVLTNTVGCSNNGNKITTTPSSSSATVHSASANSCFKLIARDLHLYHLSKEGFIQQWSQNDLTTPKINQSVQVGSEIYDFDVDKG